MENIANQHDKYFKEIFSHKEEMSDFIINALPQIAKYLDVNSLQLDTTQYIDKRLQVGYSDLVYNCKYTNKVDLKIALLFEHKSQPENFPHLQLLAYMIKIWETNIKQNQRLMPIVPILFYHGTDEWKYKKLEEYFTGIDEPLKKYLPSFDYELIDTRNLTDEQIKNMFQMLSLKTGVLVMKHIFDAPEKLINELENIFEYLHKLLETENGRNLFETTIIYLYSNLKNDKEKVTEKLKQISPKGGDIALTIAQQLEKKGHIKGIEYGIRLVATNMIKKGADDETVSEYTNLTIQQIQFLRELVTIDKF
jgi:predicted transposase/invertase (TIGR01784 family)